MSRRKKSKYSRIQLVLTSALAVAILTILALTLFFKSITVPLSKDSVGKQEFIVSRGDTTIKIANNLFEQGIIRSPLGFRYIVRKHGLGSKLQSGTYRLTPSSTTLQVATTLTAGISDVTITIPEGYRLEQIATVIESELGIPRADFLTLAAGLEGRLFPDTYYLAPTTSASGIIKLMQDTFTAKVGEIGEDTLILASLIERETRGNSEKPVVAGILQNRLGAGWPLELDATVQYVLGREGDWWSNTTLADREANSPYNTYGRTGLPPSPICNPGIESINAARDPESTDYWFYLHDRDGLIRYATTNKEHSDNIARYIY